MGMFDGLEKAQKEALARQKKQQEDIQKIGPAQQDQAMRQQMFQDQPQTYRNPDKNMSPEELEAMRSELAARKDQMVRMEPQITPYNSPNRMKPGREIEQPINRINLDQFTSGERRPFNPNPLRLGPLQQFNSMQQQMYQTEPAEPQPEIAQPMQKQEEPKIPAQQTTQAKEQEQQPVQPVKQKMMKRRM